LTHNTSISRYVSRYSFLKPVTDEPLKSLHEEVAVDELGLISDARKSHLRNLLSFIRCCVIDGTTNRFQHLKAWPSNLAG